MIKTKKLLALLTAFVILAALAAGCSDGRTGGGKKLSAEESEKTLDALLTKVNTVDVDAEMDLEGIVTTSLADELPEISTFELSVTGSGAIDAEIFASTEKGVRASSGKNIDGWLVDAAEKFNSQSFDLNGSRVSVSIRPVASGAAADYIISEKYVPAGFAPSNVLWAKLVEGNGGSLEIIENKLAGNTAGLLMSSKRYDDFTSKYGAVTLENISESVLAGELLLGYTNPYTSSTGLNMLIHMLDAFEPANPLGDTAKSQLEKMQKNIPPVAYTTTQMRETAEKGLLDAMVMEYQSYINIPELKDYKFIPFGLRHDNPLYATTACTDDQREVLKMFADYCLTDEIQKMAGDVGFNANDDFGGSQLDLSGADLMIAQGIWKEKKDAGQPIIAVFVTDVSGSMSGNPITELKTSLLNASQYIGEDNYIGLVSYSSEIYINLPIDEFSNSQRAKFNGAVKNLTPNGSTATYDAVLVGAKMLLEKKEEIPDAKLVMFLLSDGEQTDGYNFDKIAPVVEGLHIPIHTICYSEELEEMKELSLLNEASSIQATPEDVVYNLKNMFNAQM